VLGIPFDTGGGVAFPFGALRELGDLGVIHETDDAQEPIVVFWSSEASTAMAYRPSAGGQALTFEVSNSAFLDVDTGSEWPLERVALSGPRAGQRLAMIPEAYVSFWCAFSTFFENPELWLS
jgi:hypothetical protein